jgi:hypothetical protein
MPGIRFNLPHQNAQKGPTCWYYALKLIMKFHGLISPPVTGGVPNVHGKWKDLHRVRQSITDLKQMGIDHNDLSKISNNLYGKYVVGRDPHVKEAMTRVARMNTTTRFNFVEEIIGLDYIREIQITPWSITGVINALRSHGPFYISVAKAPHICSTPKADPYIPGGTSYRVKGEHFTGGPHAMVIYAAYEGAQRPFYHSPDKERVYFWNPNHPRTVFYSAWDDMSVNLNTPEPFRGATVGVAVSCNQPHNCAHISTAIGIP